MLKDRKAKVPMLRKGVITPAQYQDNAYMSLIIPAESTETRRLMLGIPQTGTIRSEWAQSRYGQIIPTNWSMSDCVQWLNQVTPLRYNVADARNIIIHFAMTRDFEWCFRPETLIETRDGAKPIREIQVGDAVLTHLGRYRTVTKTLKRRYPQHEPLLWIKTNHSVIKCTPNHPFYVLREGVRSFREAKTLTLDDRLLYPVGHLSKDIMTLNIRFNRAGTDGKGRRGIKKMAQQIGDLEITPEVARFLGLYLAEGCASTDGLIFTFGNHEQEYIDFTVKMCRELFGRVARVQRRWATQVSLCIRSLGIRFRQLFGTHARHKRIPSDVFFWNIQNRLAFLKGYIDGDGHATRTSGNSFSSASRDLIDDVMRLAHTCGLQTAGPWYLPPTSNVCNGQTISGDGAWSARLTTRSWGKLQDLSTAQLQDTMLSLALTAIEEHRVSANLIDEYVYNLEVNEDNSYIADSAAVHNCLFNDSDTMMPVDCFMKMNDYMRKGDIPIVAGLYTTKSDPPEPLIYRGAGNSYFRKFALGDKVWADGCGFGLTLVNVKIFHAMAQDAPKYTPAGWPYPPIPQIIDTPQFFWTDPEIGSISTWGGTEDLAFFKRVHEGGYFAKAGWPKIQKRKHPLMVDTSIFAFHIREDGLRFPLRFEW